MLNDGGLLLYLLFVAVALVVDYYHMFTMTLVGGDGGAVGGW